MRLAFLLISVLLLFAESAAAQPFIRVRDFVDGELAAGDSVLPDGSRYDTFRFRAEPGEAYYLYLTAEFEGAWLDVGSRLGPRCGAVCARAEEDGEAGSIVIMQFIPERPGTHVIRAGGIRGAAGGYQLTMESQEVYETVADSLWPGADSVGLPVDSLPDPAIYWVDPFPALYSGQPQEGFLGPTRHNDRGQPYDRWVYYGSAWETITVTMESDAFDTVLRIRRRGELGRAEELASDDDGGGGTNSALTVKLPTNGTYLIEATGFAESAEGLYTILLTSDGEGATTDTVMWSAWPTDTVITTTVTDTVQGFGTVPVSADSVQEAARPIRAGERMDGELHETDRQALPGYTYFDLWSLRGRAGETVTIRMSSGDFDAELQVGRWVDGMWEALGSDDDGGGGTDSALTLTFPADGEYEIHARALFPGDTGAYVLSVERR